GGPPGGGEGEEPRMASGTKRTPAAKKHTAARNRVAHPIASTPVAGGERQRGRGLGLGSWGIAQQWRLKLGAG
ncbi:unnamed protein product, partial [Urochloa humidicola]